MIERHDDLDVKELLDAMARADAALSAPATVEQRVMAGWDALQRAGAKSESRGAGHSPVGTHRNRWRMALPAIVGVAAAAVMAVLWPRPQPPGEPRKDVVVHRPAPPIPRREVAALPAAEAAPRVAAPTAARRARTVPAPRERETIDFVPLGPMDDRELSGPWQLVRVRMPRAALADLGLTPDVNRMGEPVPAEVLVGEDGVARAIRVTSSTDSWRSQ